ncbi:MAG: PKD domain-containing protein [Bacteroidota bacterium]
MNRLELFFSRIFLLAGILIICSDVSAQLKADFTVDNASGCSPLSVKFTNTTTGASPNVKWSWNLGNSNTSALPAPGATYRTEQKYTITLTATDGTVSSVKTMDIYVYKKPSIDFTVTPSGGCIPLTASYIANAAAGDGTIAQYLWDYGDGKTEQGLSFQKSTHIYTDPQTPPITLTVTNSYGCYNSLTKNNLIEISDGVKASFKPSTFAVCNAGDNVTFTNTSTGSGTLSYSWDFGDGKTSTEQSPVHSFATKGNFSVKLTTKSSSGCTSITLPITINVANFIADFDVPSLICQNTNITFGNKGTKPFDKAEWYIDNNLNPYYNYYGDISQTFYQPGDHKLKLINYYGNCKVEMTKNFTVNKVPQVSPFIADVQGACGVPVTVNFKDTSKEAVKWNWSLDYWSASSFSNSQNSSYNFTTGSSNGINLTITNKEGCTNNITKYIYYGKPEVQISVKNIDGSTYYNYNYGKCGNVSVKMTAYPDSILKDIKWNFGDGAAVSTERSPSHTYTKNGEYTITANYTTTNGCVGTAYYSTIKVIEIPAFDFTVKNGTTICGNTPTTFSSTIDAYDWSYQWMFNNDPYSYNYGSSTVKKFEYDTTYTVRMIASNSGCRDTVLKKDYVKVLPPFPKIGRILNTCAGNRGEVTFEDNTYKALKWSWSFGDGSAAEEYTVYKPAVKHTYTKTGSYKVYLTTTYNNCTVKDSAIAVVLLKQKPVLSSLKNDACGSDVVTLTLSNYEVNPAVNYYYSTYSVTTIQYADLTNANVYYSYNDSYWKTGVTGTIRDLSPGKNDLRMISTSGFFGCQDTSNFIPLKIHGPTAAFKKETHSGCFKEPVTLTDLSVKFDNTAIVKWDWNFGDGTTKTVTTGGSIAHLYSRPGSYYVTLKITDADGCTNQTNGYTNYVSVSGPKADFSVFSSVAYYSYSVPPNTTVSFSNNSADYGYYNSSLKWIFSDGTTSTSQYPSFNYKNEGAYDVSLVTYNSQTGCTDTIKKTITVRKVNSVFTYRLSYINNNSCPPVLASFTSLSTNSAKVSWNFGDGAIASNQKNVSHTYSEPGIYKVVHYSYDIYNNVDSTEDFIEVKGPYALIKADKLTACKSLEVKLDADVKYADTYTWDFGDGTVVPTTNVFAVHNYETPGIYTPALILKDVGGCSATSELPDRVIVDSLYIDFVTPIAICNTALVTFVPEVASLSKNMLQTTLQYRWVIKEDNILDTLYTETASHTFSKIGTHSVSLTVISPYGCEEELTKTVSVKPGVKAIITGIDKICEGEKTTFSGAATPPNGALTWQWIFNNGGSADIQNPAEQVFKIAGEKTIELIVDNGNCPDTARHILNVISHPLIKIEPASPFVCLTKSIQLSASGGIDYKWSSSGNIVNANAPVATVNPSSDQYYYVTVKNDAGCSSKDSILVKVIKPLNVIAKTPMFACEGNTIQLQASGADSYKWLNTDGLNNAQIADPILTTKTMTTIAVVGYDKYNCFTDTAKVNVNISKLPTVNAGGDQETIAGSETTLKASVSSNAVSWSWQPADYLSCTDCLSPVCKPKSSIDYTITVTNADGCKAKDEVHIQLICKSGLVYIPSAFTPNQDNLNERFAIHGSGIKSIRHFIIYNRWGKIVFERSNVNIGDINSGWDGTANGQILPSGNYVYSAQIECEAGDIFNYKGSVLLIR